MKKILLTILLLFITNIVYSAPATMYVTSAGAGLKDGSTWANAMGEAEFETDFEGSAEAGDIYYMAGGTYNLDSNISSGKSGTTSAPIKIIGVKSGTTNEPCVFSDWAFGDNRPLIAQGAWSFESTGGNIIFSNLRHTMTYTFGVSGGADAIIKNCKVTNTSAGFNYCFRSSTNYTFFISCEAITAAGSGFYLNNYSDAINCYAHNSLIGFDINSPFVTVLNSIADTCTTGFDIEGTVKMVLINNTIYNCTTGYDIASCYNGLFINNLIDTCTTGATATTNYLTNFWDNNCWSNNTTDVTNVTKGNNDVTASALLVDPANGNFTIGSGSPCIDAGMQPNTNIGVVGDYKWNIGTDQNDHRTLSHASAS